MQQTDAVTAYAKQVCGGEILAGTLVRKSCERHLKDLDEGAARGLFWDVEAAERVFDFFSDIWANWGKKTQCFRIHSEFNQ